MFSAADNTQPRVAMACLIIFHENFKLLQLFAEIVVEILWHREQFNYKRFNFLLFIEIMTSICCRERTFSDTLEAVYYAIQVTNILLNL